MKIHTHHTFVCILFVLTGLFMQSCRRDDHDCTPPVTTNYPIRKDLRDSIPYTGYDTLTFIRTSTGDTHMFVGKGPKEGYDLMNGIIVNENCPPDNIKMGWLMFTFASSTFDSEIEFDISYRRYGEQPYVYVYFDNQKYYDHSSFIGRPYQYTSLQIAGHTYYSIDKLYDPYVTNSFMVLYNATFGILKFKLKNGEEWELLSKK